MTGFDKESLRAIQRLLTRLARDHYLNWTNLVMRVSDDPTALAAYGAYRYLEGVDAPELKDDPYWTQRISQLVSRGAVQVSIDRRLFTEATLLDQVAVALCAAWQNGSAAYRDVSLGHGVRLYLHIAERDLESAVLTRLAEAENVTSVALVDPGVHGPDRWGWPLKIGVAGAEIGQALASYSHPQLISVDTDPVQGARYDLLIAASIAELDRAAARDVATGFLLQFVLPGDPV